MTTMTKADLVDLVAQSADVSRKEADETVQVILEGIIMALRRGEKVELRASVPSGSASGGSAPVATRRQALRSMCPETHTVLQARQAPA